MKWTSTFKQSLQAFPLALSVSVPSAWAELGEPELEDLKFGFIKLTDLSLIHI